jgi:hypothetical protein
VRKLENEASSPVQFPLKDESLAEAEGVQDGETEGVTEDVTQPGLSVEERILTNPLFGEPVVKTAPAREAYLASRERLLYGASGVTVLGQRGMYLQGTLRVIHQYIRQEFPQLAVYEHVVARCASVTRTEALLGLLSSIGHGIRRGSDEAKMRRLVNMQEEKALISGASLSIWIIHNSELLDVETCKALLDMRNLLELSGNRLFLIHGAYIDSFMKNIPTLARKFDPEELRALFGSAHPLRALSGLQEFADVLMEIDTQTIRRESPITWTEALLPQAHRNGFRLANEAPALHAAMLAGYPEGAFTDQALFDTVRSVMSMSARQDSPGFNIPPETWAKAVAMVMRVGSSYLNVIPRINSFSSEQGN